MKLVGKNKNKSKIRDLHNRNGSTLDPVTYGGVGGGGPKILENA